MGFYTDNERLKAKIERAARQTGGDAERAVEQALDRFIDKRGPPLADPQNPLWNETPEERAARFDALLAKIDALPKVPPEDRRPDFEWDEWGMPK